MLSGPRVGMSGVIAAQDDHLPVHSFLCGLSGCGMTLPALQALGHPLTIASCAVSLCVHNWPFQAPRQLDDNQLLQQ